MPKQALFRMDGQPPMIKKEFFQNVKSHGRRIVQSVKGVIAWSMSRALT